MFVICNISYELISCIYQFVLYAMRSKHIQTYSDIEQIIQDDAAGQCRLWEKNLDDHRFILETIRCGWSVNVDLRRHFSTMPIATVSFLEKNYCKHSSVSWEQQTLGISLILRIFLRLRMSLNQGATSQCYCLYILEKTCEMCMEEL